MSNQEESTVRPAPAGLSTTEDNGLEPSSYTAKRLQHASPEHLHITTRRFFIGPIPSAWLSKHRKSWYRYRPHLSTYSSKTATFGGPADLASHFHGPSFPQPDDAEEGESAEAEVGERDGKGRQEPCEDGRETVDDRALEEEESDHHAGSSAQANLSPTAKSRKARTSSSRSQGPASFVTAREAFRSPSPAKKEDRVGAPSKDSVGMTGKESSHSSLSGPVIKVTNSVDSKSSLLPHGQPHGVRNTDPKSDGSQNMQNLPPEPESSHSVEPNVGTRRPDTGNTELGPSSMDLTGDGAVTPVPVPSDRMDSPKTFRHLDPVTTGPVRFNLPNETQGNMSGVENTDSGTKVGKSLRGIRKGKAEPGQLVKAESMLVKVDYTSFEVPDSYSEIDSLKLETKLIDKWREFVVTCRKSTEDQTGFVLQMNKTRVIPILEKEHSSKKFAHEIPLTPKITKINMYSSLDKTIVLWSPWKKGTRMYVLRPRSVSSSVEWYTFLNAALGWKRPSVLVVNVPDLNLGLEVDEPFKELDMMQKPPGEDEDNQNELGRHSTDVLVDQAAKRIIRRSLSMLEHSAVADILDDWSAKGEKIGLAWRRYDRLEWIHGPNEENMYGSMAMQKTHDLELRPKKHYPTQAFRHLEGKPALVEPTPVEGFLVRLTSQKGQSRRFGKTFFKRLYFSTHNHLLCFTAPSKALPPKPPKLKRTTSDIPSASEITEETPMIYTVDPFPIDDGKIQWLAEKRAGKRKEFDQIAYEEAGRSVRSLLEADGYINLCHVVKVCKIREGTAAPRNQDDQTYSADDSQGEGDVSDSDSTAQSADDARTFEMIMRNGLVVRLQAYDKSTRKEWVKRLRKIIKYWKLRTAQDMELYKQVRHANLERLDIDEEMESYLGQFAQKWEVSRALASPELFNMCGISCCRQVTMSGVLYLKPRMRSTFKKCSVVLCHGKLLIFQTTLRKRTGKEIPHIHHERQAIVDLKDTYIYSGLVTEGDLLYHNQTFDSNHPGHHALPRVYLEDNWTSIDEDTTTCFVIWHGRKKSFFRANAQQSEGKTKQRLRYVSSLGASGRSMVFKTRSRAERDHWVMSISLEIERLQEEENIRVVAST